MYIVLILRTIQQLQQQQATAEETCNKNGIEKQAEDAPSLIQS